MFICLSSGTTLILSTLVTSLSKTFCSAKVFLSGAVEEVASKGFSVEIIRLKGKTQRRDQMVDSVRCEKDALTGFVGWLLQGVLAGLAFTCLIGRQSVFLLHKRQRYRRQ